MRVPVSWLSECVDVPPLSELLPRLTELGHMVDGPVEPADRGPVVSIEVRQNRPDCLSVLGVAREVAAAFGCRLRDVRMEELPPGNEAGGGEDHVCFLHIRGASLEALPEPLLADLESYGQRPVSPLVDLANYVTVELGQPLHVYAANRIDVVSAGSRRARAGESLELIDGRTVALTEDDLVIADARGPLALAGVMGGAGSAVGPGVGDIVVEAGNFRAHMIRRMARRHGLATEASLRSSKLLPPELPELALGRFLALLSEHGQVGEAELWRTGPAPEMRRATISLDHRDIERIGGMPVAPERAVQILQSLGFVDVTRDGRSISATPPPWRTDISHPADLIEEVLRVEGYSHIAPAVLPAHAPTGPAAGAWEQEEAVRALLCAWGYDEVILDSFLVDEVGEFGEGALRVENPPAGNSVLRPSLLPNMLSGARYLPFLVPERRLFEIGHTYSCVDSCPMETRTVAWALLSGGAPAGANMAEGRVDYHSLKAEAGAALRALGVAASAEMPDDAPFPFLAGRSARFVNEHGEIVGRVGELDHAAYGLKPVRSSFGVELYLPAPEAQLAQVPRTVRRDAESFDISVLAGTDTRASLVERAIAEALGPELITVRHIDTYASQDLGEARRSLTFRVVYAASRGTAREMWEEMGDLLERRLRVGIRGVEERKSEEL